MFADLFVTLQNTNSAIQKNSVLILATDARGLLEYVFGGMDLGEAEVCGFDSRREVQSE